MFVVHIFELIQFWKSEFFRNLRHVCDGGNGLVVNRAFKLAENRTSERHSKKIPAGCQVQTTNCDLRKVEPTQQLYSSSTNFRSITMASTQTLFVVLLFTVLALCQAFVPNEIQSRGASRRPVKTAPTELYMGLFDKKPAKKAPTKKAGSNFLDGGGQRITIREDEDAAMWVDEPKPKPAPKKGKK